MTAPLFVTRDQTLLDELLRLAAAAGVTPDVAGDGAAALRGWAAAPLVLVGADLAAEVARLRPARRPGVHLVVWGARARRAVPHRRRRRRRERRRAAHAPTAGWSSCSPTSATRRRGGARCSAWSAAPAAPGPRRSPARWPRWPPGAGPAVVVDADPLGPGSTGCSASRGAPAPAGTRCARPPAGSAPASLREALPRREALGVLTWHAGTSGTLQAFAVREALSAAAAGPRHRGGRPAAPPRRAGRRGGGALRPAARGGRGQRSRAWPRRAGCARASPTRPGSGWWCAARPSAPTRSPAPPGCPWWRGWPTSAASPRRSTSAWGRCGPAAARWAGPRTRCSPG